MLPVASCTKITRGIATTGNAMDSVTQNVAAVPSTLTEFTLFPKLPTELRQKIFKHALPTGPQGLRMLKVAADKILTNHTTAVPIHQRTWTSGKFGEFKGQADVSRSEGSSHITFQLLEHKHNVYVKNLNLLRACSESRGVYLKHFQGTLRVREEGLIRFSKDDIVYIINLFDLVQTRELIRILRDGKAFTGIPCQNLALADGPFGMDWKEEWDPDVVDNYGGFMSLFPHCKELMVVGAVWNDLDEFVDTVVYEEYARDGLPTSWKQSALIGVGETRKLWAESKKFGKNKEKAPELCVWDMDGNRVESEKTEDQASTAT